jgi:hypothetical protein
MLLALAKKRGNREMLDTNNLMYSHDGNHHELGEKLKTPSNAWT